MTRQILAFQSPKNTQTHTYTHTYTHTNVHTHYYTIHVRHIHRDLIYRLREDGATKVARIKQLEAMVVPRPISRERLPPMDTTTYAAAAPPNGNVTLTPQQQQQQVCARVSCVAECQCIC
jgi:hypothetical protein